MKALNNMSRFSSSSLDTKGSTLIEVIATLVFFSLVLIVLFNFVGTYSFQIGENIYNSRTRETAVNLFQALEEDFDKLYGEVAVTSKDSDSIELTIVMGDGITHDIRYYLVDDTVVRLDKSTGKESTFKNIVEFSVHNVDKIIVESPESTVAKPVLEEVTPCVKLIEVFVRCRVKINGKYLIKPYRRVISVQQV